MKPYKPHPSWAPYLFPPPKTDQPFISDNEKAALKGFGAFVGFLFGLAVIIGVAWLGLWLLFTVIKSAWGAA